MLKQMLLGGALIFVSVVVQAGFVGALFAAVERLQPWSRCGFHSLRRGVVIGASALWLMVGHTVSVWLWAVALLALDVFQDLDTAVYFSAVSFTTLGFGDIIPPKEWRQLAGLSAANGLLIFGVSAAVLVEVARQLWTPNQRDDPTKGY